MFAGFLFAFHLFATDARGKNRMLELMGKWKINDYDWEFILQFPFFFFQRYPEGGAMGAKGIDSWLSVWSNGLLLENVDENHKRVTRFFPIDSLHYCAAVRYVLVPASASPPPPPLLQTDQTRMARFLPLDSPFARQPNIEHPPLFACIMRRTTGIKVLECHVFICKRETAANALVRCCFHAYADSTYAHHLENGGSRRSANGRATNGTGNPESGDDLALNSIEKVEGWRMYQEGEEEHQTETGVNGTSVKNGLLRTERAGSTSSNGMGSASVSMLILDHGSADEDGLSLLNGNGGDANHKVWLPTSTPSHSDAAAPHFTDYGQSNTMRSARSSASAMHPPRAPRPRQIPSVAPPPPPPPIFLAAVDETDSKHKRKLLKKKKKNPSVLRDDDMSSVMTAPAQRASSVFNFPIHGAGRVVNPGHPGHPGPPLGHPGLMAYPYFSGRRPPNGYLPPHPAGPMGPPPGAILVPVPLPAGSKKSKGLKFGTFSARGKKSKKSMALAAPMGPIMIIPPHHGGGGHPGMQGPPMPMAAPPAMALGMPVPIMAPPLSMRRSTSRMTLAAEEPIYMPAAVRPLSPIASYQPAHFPHEAYLMQQQYTAMEGGADASTLSRPSISSAKKKTSKKKQQQQSMLEIQTLASGDDGEEEEEASLAGQSAGIYRKGHLNERAFSYSIRQEHRSRSYSSLTNFPAGGDDLRSPDKKERELIQMVHDLDLSGDDLERSEVPLAMYPHHRQPR